MFDESTLPNDTSKDAERILIEGYRKMSPARKPARVSDLSETMRLLSRQRIIERSDGSLSEREIRLRSAALYIDREIMRAAFGYDVDAENGTPCR